MRRARAKASKHSGRGVKGARSSEWSQRCKRTMDSDERGARGEDKSDGAMAGKLDVGAGRSKVRMPSAAVT